MSGGDSTLRRGRALTTEPRAVVIGDARGIEEQNSPDATDGTRRQERLILLTFNPINQDDVEAVFWEAQ